MVVQLSGKSPQKEIIGDKLVEIWIRQPRKSEIEPLKIVPCSGTGFWIKDGEKVYLVTAEHVARCVSINTKITIMNSDGHAQSIPLEDIAVNKPIEWTFHDHADVAAIQINFPKISASVSLIPISAFSDRLSAPERSLELTVIGFPLSLGVDGKFSPISKSAHNASDIFTYARFDNALQSDFYILDDPAAAGFSGAPVFRLPHAGIGSFQKYQGDLIVTGLVHGNHGDPKGSKFAAIVPSKYILETIKAIPAKVKH